MLDALKNKLAEKAKQAKEATGDYLENINLKVADDIREKRLNICKSCDEFHKSTEFCRVCGCYMPAKTWIASQSCPLKKWIRIEKKA